MKNVDFRKVKVAGCGNYRTLRTRLGVRMVQHGTVLSEVCEQPGATQSLVDVMAAVVSVVGTGSRIAMLGFAGGGFLAPLRALGCEHTVSAVDLDDSGWKLFQRLCAGWAGQVEFERAEASAWLRGHSRCHDLIVEDLSVAMNSDVFKPAMTWAELPSLIYRRLAPQGVALFNLLPPTDGPWASGFGRILQAGWDARLVLFTDYENRLLLVSRELPPARKLSHQMLDNLTRIGSRLASRISVRHWNQVVGTDS